jgi:4-amino-4-deoxy-L-arabinose transferase-like glycosyltransferase
VAFAFGGHSAAALVHLSFLICLPLLILCYGRRFNLVPASVFAAVLVFVSPVFGLTGSAAYNDAALVTCSFAVFYCLEVVDEQNNSKYLILCGLFCGYCFSIKYTGGIAAAFAVTWLVFRRRRVSWFRFLVAAAVCSAPWLFRNWIWLGNPVAPFFNRWFRNPYFSASYEKAYLSDVAHFEGLRHWWEYPLDVTSYGARIPGLLGPVFLLAPFAALALRSRQGRRLLAAAVVFSVPFGFNAATRFLMPGMPFLALALGIGIQDSPGVVPLLVAAQALLCWPSVTPLYAADWSWRIREIPVRAAFRLEPEADFLRRRLPDYNLKPAIARVVAASAKIFSFSTRPEAYLGRTIVVGYESAEGHRAQEALLDRWDTGALKDLGIGYLLINEADSISAEIKQNSRDWHVTALAESNGTILYRID